MFILLHCLRCFNCFHRSQSQCLHCLSTLTKYHCVTGAGLLGLRNLTNQVHTEGRQTGWVREGGSTLSTIFALLVITFIFLKKSLKFYGLERTISGKVEWKLHLPRRVFAQQEGWKFRFVFEGWRGDLSHVDFFDTALLEFHYEDSFGWKYLVWT